MNVIKRLMAGFSTIVSLGFVILGLAAVAWMLVGEGVPLYTRIIVGVVTVFAFIGGYLNGGEDDD